MIKNFQLIYHFGNMAGSVNTQSLFLTGVWQEVQTCVPKLKGFCSNPTQRAQPQP
jgi:hypothetical protein